MPRRKTRKNHKGGMDGTSTSLGDKIGEGISDIGNTAMGAIDRAQRGVAAASDAAKAITDARYRAKNNISTPPSSSTLNTSDLTGGKRKSRKKKRKTKRRKKRRTKRRRKSRRKRRR